MCRLVGVVSSESTDFAFSLRKAPRSLAALSSEHPHGWGLAVHARGEGWQLHKDALCAGEDRRFHQISAEVRGEVLIAHVRKRTVGGSSLANTHPFQRGAWVFAHNGTIRDLEYIEAKTSPARRAEIEGDTDSERLFAFLLTELDEVGCGVGAPGPEPRARASRAVARAMGLCRAREGFGPANFLLSDGETMLAHRWGRELHLLLRGPGDRVLTVRTSQETDAVISTRWSKRRVAALVASERLSTEPWSEVPEGALLLIEGGEAPVARLVEA